MRPFGEEIAEDLDAEVLVFEVVLAGTERGKLGVRHGVAPVCLLSLGFQLVEEFFQRDEKDSGIVQQRGLGDHGLFSGMRKHGAIDPNDEWHAQDGRGALQLHLLFEVTASELPKLEDVFQALKRVEFLERFEFGQFGPLKCSQTFNFCCLLCM